MSEANRSNNPTDRLDRPLSSLRVSVTDKCNIRCRYCMPEDEYEWLPHDSILRLEETARLIGVFAGLGVNKVRFTGGEPLVRRNLVELIKLVSLDQRISDIALTTNGVLLQRHAESLRKAGTGRVTVSLDTLRPDRYKEFTRSPRFGDVLAGIDALRAEGFAGTKLNAVVIRGFNDDELIDLLEFSKAKEIELRFIEYMDVGGATRWSMNDVVSQTEMLEKVAARYGTVTPVVPTGDYAKRAPATQFVLPDGTMFGIVASTTKPFCELCDRSRLTADGMWFRCLYASDGISLKDPLRSSDDNRNVADLITSTWAVREDRGAEDRLLIPNRGAFRRSAGQCPGPHHEMHARGG
ncbi:GTP 3',8-cyclase MoaA [Gemmatimonadota bacterium]